jgi:hypothetical protein
MRRPCSAAKLGSAQAAGQITLSQILLIDAMNGSDC